MLRLAYLKQRTNACRELVNGFKKMHKSLKRHPSGFTPEETAKFKAERNAKRDAERYAKKHPAMVHVSKRSADYYLKLGLKPTGRTFRGSIRSLFTGARRNNHVTI